MTNNQRAIESYNHDVEVIQFIDMANAIGMYSNKQTVPDVLVDGDFFSSFINPKGFHPSTELIQAWLKSVEAQDLDEEELTEALYESRRVDLMGIYLYINTPAPREDGMRTWGICRGGWVYGDTYEQAFQHAVEWAKEVAGE